MIANLSVHYLVRLFGLYSRGSLTTSRVRAVKYL